jgi:hypothetical protein
MKAGMVTMVAIGGHWYPLRVGDGIPNREDGTGIVGSIPAITSTGAVRFEPASRRAGVRAARAPEAHRVHGGCTVQR